MSTATVGTPNTGKPTRVSWIWAIWILPCVAVACYAIFHYVVRPPAQGHFSQRLLLLQVHASGGALALLTGPWQFWTGLRLRHREWHRWCGRIFLLSVAASSLAGLTLAGYSEEGWATHLGFGLLAAVWFWTAWMGYDTARRKQFTRHREWMIRSFALALAAVTLRIDLPVLLFVAHSSFHVAYITVSWFSWLPNLAVVEWWLRRTPARLQLSRATLHSTR